MDMELPRIMQIGAVSYLNSKPLIEDLPGLVTDAELILNYPSRLADDLALGHLDVALIPSVELFRNPEYEVVSDVCVATRGQVLSVKLYSRVPWSDVRTLALDEGSRTSCVLAQILLAERYGVRPNLETLSLGQPTSAAQTDAVLLIGDRAIQPLAETFADVWDLGEEWLNWTGLPFVFALWATRRETELGRLEDALSETRNRGLANIEQIARREAPLLGISEQTAYCYLTENLNYQIGSAERAGLKLFHQLAAKLGMVQEGYQIVYRHYASA